MGHWLVETLGLSSPDRLSSRFSLEPEDPALDYLESFVLKQIALRVLQSAARGPQDGDSGTFLENGFSSLEKSALRIVVADASDEVRESILRYIEERDLGAVKVVQLLRDQALHTISSELHPPKEAILVCLVAKFRAVEEGLTQWFAYVALTELLPDWVFLAISHRQIFEIWIGQRVNLDWSCWKHWTIWVPCGTSRCSFGRPRSSGALLASMTSSWRFRV